MKRTVVALVALSLFAAPAVADSRRNRDPRDTESAFDVRAVRHGHDGELLTHTIRTHRAWSWHEARCFDSSSKCRAMFRIYIYKRRYGGDYVRYAEVFRRQGKTYGFVYRFEPSCFSPTDVCFGSQPETVGRAKVTRPSSRKMRISFPETFLPDGLDRYFWSSYVVFWRPNECSTDSGAGPDNGYYCWDYAPNNGAPPIKHRL